MESEKNDGSPPEPEETVGRWAEYLEEAVVEIRNMLPFLETAFSGIEYAAVALRAMDPGFDRHTAFWPQVFHKEATYGMAWRDDPELVNSIKPPPDPDPGWKLDPHYGDGSGLDIRFESQTRNSTVNTGFEGRGQFQRRPITCLLGETRVSVLEHGPSGW